MRWKELKKARVFHRCFFKNQDDTNRIIGKGERCLFPTSQPFWKQVADILSTGPRTRSQKKSEKTVNRADFNRYHRQKGRENIKRWL